MGINEHRFRRAVEGLLTRSRLDSSARATLLSVVENLFDQLDDEPQPDRDVDPESETGTLDPADPLETITHRPSVDYDPEETNPFRPADDGGTRRTPPPSPTTAALPRIGRFINEGLVGRGGMGEVYRVRDPDLDRRMVLKILRPDRADDTEAVTRFLLEAQLTSQLHHPGIVSVHELGVLEGDRLYFTMREVRGRTLDQVIADAHRDLSDEEDVDWPRSPTFHELIDLFHRICQPIAYAHSRGIIHRDLKPSNIMVGDFGEVQILDWGLAKHVGDDASEGPAADPDDTELWTRKSAFTTHRGSIVGTPAFMPPEQARGHVESLGPTSDVYALGTILYMILDGDLPFEGPNAASILFQVVDGIDEPPAGDDGPEELVELCVDAMAVDPDDRPADAAGLAEVVAEWRAGSHRRKKALELVAEADDLLPRVDELEERARELRDRSRQMLQKIPDTASVDEKRPAWSLEDEAQLLDREAGTQRSRAIQKLDAALAQVPDLEEAHQRLAAIYQREHAAAERRRDQTRATSLEVFLRTHNTGTFDEYLEGREPIELRTRPAGASVTLHRYIQQNRRLHPGLERRLGTTPIAGRQLPIGSYLLEIDAAHRAAIRYPLHVGRSRPWIPTDPETGETPAIALPYRDELDDDEIYVPAGPFRRGGDERATNSPPREIQWVDGFVIRRHPVTHREYLRFLNDLLDRGRTDKARSHCPRNVGIIGYGGDSPLYELEESGEFVPRPDDPDFLNLPVCLIDWRDARAYARWRADRTGQSWRLPTPDEWEKAARGVDGRFYPWGDVLDPTWCQMVRSTPEAPRPVPVEAMPDDESPYGLRGAAGNVRDWCRPEDPGNFDDIDDETTVPLRGGCWFSTAEMCRVAAREYKVATARSAGIGVRLARDYRSDGELPDGE